MSTTPGSPRKQSLISNMPESPRKQSLASEYMEPKRKPKGKSRRSKTPDFLCLKEDDFSDVTIKAEDRCISFNSCILSYNSPKFRELLSVDSPGKAKAKAPVSKTLDLSDQKFLTVCKMVNFIDPRCENDLDEDDAICLIPIADEYQIIHLKKACESTITQSFGKKRKGRRSGSIPTKDTMQYLLLADKYELKELKDMCTAEMVDNNNPFSCKAMSEQDELSEHMKRLVLEQKLERANRLLAKARRVETAITQPSDTKGNKIWNKML